MADKVCAMGYGEAAYYARLPAASDALVLVLLKKTGIQSDSILQNYTNLASMIAGSPECTAANYSRQQVTTGTTVTWDTVNRRKDCSFPPKTIATLGDSTTLQQVQKLVVCYWPTVGTGGDSAILPLTFHDYFHVCDGTDFLLSLPSGFYRDA